MTTSTSSPAIVWPDPAEFEQVTDKETGIRHYRRKGGPWRVSSTTVLGVIAKGYRYDSWIDDQRVDAYDTAIAKAILDPVAPEYLLATIKARMGTRRPYMAKRDSAADLGSEVHAAVRAYLESQLSGHAPPIPKLSPEGLVNFSTFVGWWQESGLEPVVMEQPLIEPAWGYGGTLDICARRKDGTYGIVDLKNSKYISDSHHLQVASYIRAARQHAPVTWGVIAKMPKGGRPMEIRQLGEAMWCGNRTPEQCEQGFKHALDLWRFLNKETA